MTIEPVAFADVDGMIASRRDRRRQEHHRPAARAPLCSPASIRASDCRRHGSGRARATSASPICWRSTRRGCGWNAGWRRTRSPCTAATCGGTRATSAASVSSIPTTVNESTVAGYVDELRNAAHRGQSFGSQFRGSGPSAVRAGDHRTRGCRGALVPSLLRRRRTAGVRSERRHRKPRVPQGIPKALSEAEVTALLNAVAGEEPRRVRDRAMLETLYGAGLRISELGRVSMSEISICTTASCECSARVRRNASRRSVVPRAAIGDYLTRGRPELYASTSARGVHGVPEVSRRSSHASGCVVGRAGRR